MVIFSRKLREEVIVGGIDGLARQLKVTVLEIDRGKVTLGIEVAAEEPTQFDRSHPAIRALVARLWRQGSARRNRGDHCEGRDEVVHQLESEGLESWD